MIVSQMEGVYTNGMSWPRESVTTETVMTNGMRIHAKTDSNYIDICAGKGYARSYNWAGEVRKVDLWPRIIRWYGAFGLYYPGPGNHWKSVNGVRRGVLEEGHLWFTDADHLMAWIKRESFGQNCVYSSDGLLVAWSITPDRRQINVSVYQLMVGQEKPKWVPGCDDSGIKVTWN